MERVMTSISAINGSAALALWRSNTYDDSAIDFLNSPVFSASSDEVFKSLLKGFSGKTLGQQYSSVFEGWTSAAAAAKFKMMPDNARHNALVDVIMANRDDFPPEEFTVHTDFPGGAWVTTTIPSAASTRASTFKGWLTEYQAAFNEAGNKAAPLDPSSVKLDALERAVKTLVLNGQDDASVGSDPGKTAYAILTQKLFGSDEDDLETADTSGVYDKPDNHANVV
jgi:hypothetical protein